MPSIAEGEATNRAVALAAAARRADPDRARLGRRGDRRDPRRADQGPQDLRRDLPAISVPDRRRYRHGPRRHQILLLAAAARPRRRRKRCGAACRTARSRCSRPTTRPIATTRPANCRRATRRHSRTPPTACPASSCALPLLFSEGVGKGRIDLNRFVALTATNHAKLYGLYPKKGTIAVGSDADIAIWDPRREVTVTRRGHCTTMSATRPMRAGS